MRELLSVWKGRGSALLLFSEIKDGFGADSRETSYYLSEAVKAGYLTRVKGKRGRVHYKNMLVDYKGYFDALDFVEKVAEFCLKKGMVESLDYYVSTFSPVHLLTYGTHKLNDMTPLELELMSGILGRMSFAFLDYVRLCEAINRRIQYEKKEILPHEVKATLFTEDKQSGKSRRKTGSLHLKAASQIYGDVLWEHIFHKMMDDLRFQLVQGTLDLTGVEELIRVREDVINFGSNISELIYKQVMNGWGQKNDLMVEKLMKHFSMPRLLGSRTDFESTAYSVVITPSPRTIDEYAEKIGKIAEDQVNAWSDTGSDMLKVIAKGGTIWEDKLRLRDKVLTRKEVLKISLVDRVSLMRFHRKEPITQVEEKFMQEDENLRRVFSKQEIYEMAQKAKNLIQRASKFYELIASEIPGAKIRDDPEWFTKDEIIFFKLADDVDYAVPRN